MQRASRGLKGGKGGKGEAKGGARIALSSGVLLWFHLRKILVFARQLRDLVVMVLLLANATVGTTLSPKGSGVVI